MFACCRVHLILQESDVVYVNSNSVTIKEPRVHVNMSKFVLETSFVFDHAFGELSSNQVTFGLSPWLYPVSDKRRMFMNEQLGLSLIMCLPGVEPLVLHTARREFVR